MTQARAKRRTGHLSKAFWANFFKSAVEINFTRSHPFVTFVLWRTAQVSSLYFHHMYRRGIAPVARQVHAAEAGYKSAVSSSVKPVLPEGSSRGSSIRNYEKIEKALYSRRAVDEQKAHSAILNIAHWNNNLQKENLNNKNIWVSTYGVASLSGPGENGSSPSRANQQRSRPAEHKEARNRS